MADLTGAGLSPLYFIHFKSKSMFIQPYMLSRVPQVSAFTGRIVGDPRTRREAAFFITLRYSTIIVKPTFLYQKLFLTLKQSHKASFFPRLSATCYQVLADCHTFHYAECCSRDHFDYRDSITWSWSEVLILCFQKSVQCKRSVRLLFGVFGALTPAFE